MRFDLVTIFPHFFTGPLDHGIVRRSREAGLIKTPICDLRLFTHDRHRTVDDRPFGGGEGMVMKPEPFFEAVESLLAHVSATDTSHTVAADTSIILLSAAGKLFTQSIARRLAEQKRVILLCGRYEGVDERVAEHLATDELSIGNFVLSGGELAAALVVDAVTRLIPGALGNEDSVLNESFTEEFAKNTAPGSESWSGPWPVLDCPHFTRPQSFRGWDVPEVLLGGNHEEIRKWRQQMALEKTMRNRPDLLAAPKTSAESPDEASSAD